MENFNVVNPPFISSTATTMEFNLFSNHIDKLTHSIVRFFQLWRRILRNRVLQVRFGILQNESLQIVDLFVSLKHRSYFFCLSVFLEQTKKNISKRSRKIWDCKKKYASASKQKKNNSIYLFWHFLILLELFFSCTLDILLELPHLRNTQFI